MYNKFKTTKANTQKVLHKVKKQWVIVSIALFALIGGGSISTHASATNVPVASQQNESENAKKFLSNKSVVAKSSAFHSQLLQKASGSASANVKRAEKVNKKARKSSEYHSLTSFQMNYANQIKADITDANSYSRSKLEIPDNTHLDSATSASLSADYNQIDQYALGEFSDASDFNPYTYDYDLLNQSYVDSFNNRKDTVSSAVSNINHIATSASASLSASATNSNVALAQSVADSVENSMNASYADEINSLSNRTNLINTNNANNYSTAFSNNDNSSAMTSIENEEHQHEANDDMKISQLEDKINELKSDKSSSSKKNKSHKYSNHTKNTSVKYLYNLTSRKIKRAKVYLKHHKHSKRETKRLRVLIKQQKQYKAKLHQSSQKVRPKKRRAKKQNKRHSKKKSHKNVTKSSHR